MEINGNIKKCIFLSFTTVIALKGMWHILYHLRTSDSKLFYFSCMLLYLISTLLVETVLVEVGFLALKPET